MSRLAVVQPAAPWADAATMRERTVRLLRQAAAAGGRLAVLPELCTVSYDFRTREEVAPSAEPLDGPTVRAWHAVARETGMWVLGGLPERDGRDLRNSAVLVGPAGLLGVYRKVHLYHFEREVFAPGDRFEVWETPVGRLAPLICYDLRFAEAVRLLVLRGAEVLAVPTTWTDRGKPQPWDARGWCGAAYLAAGYAYGSRLWVACADRAGQDGGVRTLGCSLIVDPHGMVQAGPAAPDREEVLTAEVRGPTPRATAEMDLIADRRPELYTELVAGGGVRPTAPGPGEPGSGF